MTSNDTRYKGQTFRYDRIDTVLNYDMSNNIADILIDEINNIIQTIAPSRLIQCKNRYNKWYDKDIELQAYN